MHRLQNASDAYSSGEADMTISDLLELLGHRVTALKNQRVLMHELGDVEGVVAVDNEITETEALIAQLRAL